MVFSKKYAGLEEDKRAYHAGLAARLSGDVKVIGADGNPLEEYMTPEWQECLTTPDDTPVSFKSPGHYSEYYASRDGKLKCAIHWDNGGQEYANERYENIKDETTHFILRYSDGRVVEFRGWKGGVLHNKIAGSDDCPASIFSPAYIFSERDKDTGQQRVTYSEYYDRNRPLLKVQGLGGPVCLIPSPR
ncbi:MAG: hypothetical protein P4M13_05195 [Alphaproteobacteria bacterium]|nr:hypothetical protein [Alphaproteobacteria bacterium]